MKILITAFSGSSSQRIIEKIDVFDVLILENNKEKSTQQLYNILDDKNYDYIFSLGQRPNIKDKIYIETTAKREEMILSTEFDVNGFNVYCKDNDIVSKISNNAGTSFCNHIYFSGLEYIKNNKCNTKMVFIHVPFDKNIGDINLLTCHLIDTIITFTGD